MEKEITNLSLRKDIKERAIKEVDAGRFPGISSLSGLVEKALEEILGKAGVDFELEGNLRELESRVQSIKDPEQRARAETLFVHLCESFGFKKSET